MTAELIKAAQQALDALKKKHGHWGPGHDQLNAEAITALEHALNQRPAAQTEDDVFMPRRLAATQKLTQLGYHYDSMQGRWLPASQQATPEPVGEVDQIDIDEDGSAHAWIVLHDNVELGTKLYIRPVPVETTPVGEPFGWAVNSTLFRGEFAEADAKAEAKRCGGTTRAVALYTRLALGAPNNNVLVPLQVLKDASEALGNFVSDHGWGDSDMQAMDNLDAIIAQHGARSKENQA